MAKTKTTPLERIMNVLFILATAVSIIAVGLICWFVFSTAIPTIGKIGVKEFVLGSTWKPSKNLFGILPMIVGSLYVTLGAAVIGVPIGVLTAVYMVFYCPKKIKGLLQAGINLLAGIPSVVYGLWALEEIVPLIRNTMGGYGLSILAAMILLGIMILPTVIALSQSALEAVPSVYYQGAVGLGASKERAIFTVVVPAAGSGILASIIMGIGRAIGETMAVQMVIGNSPLFPTGLLKPGRTMTTNITTEMAYASGLHRESLIATGAILFIFILVINIIFNIFKNKPANKEA